MGITTSEPEKRGKSGLVHGIQRPTVFERNNLNRAVGIERKSPKFPEICPTGNLFRELEALRGKIERGLRKVCV